MRPWIALVLILLPSLLLGCRGDDVPADFRLRLGESGGVTGWTSGYRLAADGAVSRYQTRLDGETTETGLGSLTEDQRRALWERLAESGLLEEVPESSGNLTRFIEVTTGDATHRARWAVTASGESKALEDVYRYCVDVLSADR